MRSPVVVASTWSASQAELLAGHLRSRGIESFTKTNLDRVAYSGEFGGARVFVDADKRLEAELEIVLLDDGHPSGGPIPAGAPCVGTIHRSRRRWVHAAGWTALGAMALGAALPVVRVIWETLAR